MRTGMTLHEGGRRVVRAAAVVEFAVVLPLILTVLFGIIEFGWAFMVCHTLNGAAREGCRIAVLPGSTDNDTTARVAAVMKSAGFNAGTYTTTLTHATTADPTETVTVSMPYSKVTIVGSYLGLNTNRTLKSCAAMHKEGI